jgi:hypothetical protein
LRHAIGTTTVPDVPPNVTVYRSPSKIEILMESITRLIEREPDCVFHDRGVRDAGRRLAGVIHQRVDEEQAS